MLFDVLDARMLIGSTESVPVMSDDWCDITGSDNVRWCRKHSAACAQLAGASPVCRMWHFHAVGPENRGVYMGWRWPSRVHLDPAAKEQYRATSPLKFLGRSRYMRHGTNLRTG